MNNEEELIIYIKNCYNKYSKNNFESVIDYCYSFGINYNEYNKDISKKVYSLTNNIINTLKLKKIKCSHAENKMYVKINIIYKSENYPSSKANVCIPILIENYDKVINNILKYIIEKKCNSSIKLSKIICNNLLTITFDNCKLVNDFINYYLSCEELKKDKKRSIVNIIPKITGMGIYSEVYPYNYIDTFNNLLCEYFHKLKDVDEINSETFKLFLENSFKNETIKLKKEMIKKIIKSVNIIVEDIEISNLFEYNGEMNLGSYNPSEYNLLINDNKIIYFENKEKTILINFGSEEYLNLCYSFFYKNVISKSNGEIYYSFFRNVYLNLLEKKYSCINDLYNIDTGEDIIYKELTFISSAYFAYKKLDFDYKEIYSIIKIVLENNLKCKLLINDSERKIIENTFVSFPFNIEYASKIVLPKNGAAIKIIDYFEKYNVLKYIPLDSVVYLKDKSSMPAEEFLKKVYEFIPEYTSFIELFNNKIEFIEYNN